MKQENSTYNITEKTYQSIEFLPIWNWYEVLKTGDLKHLFRVETDFTDNIDSYEKLKGLSDNFYNKKRLSKLRIYFEKVLNFWDEIQDEYINEFGLEDNFKKKIRLLKEKAILNYEFILTGDRFINTELAIINADLEEIGSAQGISFYQQKSQLEKHKGGARIDPKKTTVIEWFYDLKNMSNG